MLNRETKARIRRNRSARRHAPGYLKLITDFQDGVIPGTLAVGMLVGHSKGLIDATMQVAEMAVQLNRALTRYFGRERPTKVIWPHSTRMRLRNKALRAKHQIPDDVIGFAITDEGKMVDMRSVGYLEMLNTL